jgi:hypothetical protein
VMRASLSGKPARATPGPQRSNLRRCGAGSFVSATQVSWRGGLFARDPAHRSAHLPLTHNSGAGQKHGSGESAAARTPWCHKCTCRWCDRRGKSTAGVRLACGPARSRHLVGTVWVGGPSTDPTTSQRRRSPPDLPRRNAKASVAQRYSGARMVCTAIGYAIAVWAEREAPQRVSPWRECPNRAYCQRDAAA